MADDLELVIYELVDTSLLEIPARSYLYHLAPIGIGTMYVESLTSYVVRLAEAHRVLLRILLLEVILPLFGRLYLANPEYHSLSAFWKKNCRALNGIGSWASDWVHVLETLTLHDDLRFLTMLPWAEVLPSRGLLRLNRAWCPLCYEEWRQTKQVIYEPLLWHLDVITVCPYHQQPLSLQCPNCKKALPFLTPRAQSGYCSECARWLGQMSEEKPPLTTDELKWHIWTANAVGELLASAPKLPTPPSRELIAEIISTWVDQVAGGDASNFARDLQQANIQASRWSVWDWRQGKQLPQFSTFMRLCYYLGANPSSLLVKEILPQTSTQIDLPMVNRTDLKPKNTRQRFNARKLGFALDKIIASNEQPPPSMAEVAKRLNQDHSHLLKLFADRCYVISKRYRDYQRAQSAQRKQLVRNEVRQVVLKIHAEGRYPSRRQVSKLLSNPNLMRLPEAREMWRTTLKELGWNQSTPQNSKNNELMKGGGPNRQDIEKEL